MTGPRNLNEFFELDVLPSLAVEVAYAGVEFHDTRGRYWVADCPFGCDLASGNTFYVDRETLRWTCVANCKRGGNSLLSFLCGGRFPRPGSNSYRTAVAKATSMTGLQLPHARPETSHESQVAEFGEQVAGLMETFFLYAFLRLRSAEFRGAEQLAAQAWLKARGLCTDETDALPLGLLADCRQMRDLLEAKGFSREETSASQLMADPRLSGRIVGPIRNERGRIVGFWARRPDSQIPRLLFRGTWKQAVPVFGLDVALRAGRDVGHPLILVEDLFDVLLLHAKGLLHAAAILGPVVEMTSERWENLATLGVRRVILCPSSQSQDDGLTERALGNARQAIRAPEVFLLPPDHFRPHPSPGALVDSEGLPALESLITQLLLNCGITDRNSEKARTGARRSPIHPIPISDGSPRSPILLQTRQTEAVPREKPDQPRIVAFPTWHRIDPVCPLHGCHPMSCFCFD
jgi:hypothetical protein